MTEEVQGHQEPERHYQILVYGIEKKGLSAPKQLIRTRNFTLYFEDFCTARRFNEFDATISFQGIFESFERQTGYYSRSSLRHFCDRDQLDKRKKEAVLLLQKGGVLCFLLTDRFIDSAEGRRFEGSDLVKYHLNYGHFYRENFEKRIAHLDTKSDDFRRFLDLHGAASSYFYHHNDRLDCRIVAEVNGRMVAMVLEKLEYFLPVLIPENRPEKVEEFFTLLADALVASNSKLYQLLPSWIDGFRFSEEQALDQCLVELKEEMAKIDARMNQLNAYKGVLALTGTELVRAVTLVFREGFGFNVDATDDFREDFKLLDDQRNPLILCEVKGTNKGVKREHVNQADSHRERSGFDHDFATLLIVNTNIKNARSLSEKDQDVTHEQVLHARRIGVLILRTIDVLWLLHSFVDGALAREQIIGLFCNNTGWLRATGDGYSILTGEENREEP